MLWVAGASVSASRRTLKCRMFALVLSALTKLLPASAELGQSQGARGQKVAAVAAADADEDDERVEHVRPCSSALKEAAGLR